MLGFGSMAICASMSAASRGKVSCCCKGMQCLQRLLWVLQAASDVSPAALVYIPEEYESMAANGRMQHRATQHRALIPRGVSSACHTCRYPCLCSPSSGLFQYMWRPVQMAMRDREHTLLRWLAMCEPGQLTRCWTWSSTASRLPDLCSPRMDSRSPRSARCNTGLCMCKFAHCRDGNSPSAA